MGAGRASGRTAAYEYERAVLFGLVEPPRRREQLCSCIKRLGLLVAASFAAMFGAPAAVALAANVYSVSSNSNDVNTANSLPWAINQANTHPGNGTNTIQLAAGTPALTINPQSSLSITAPVVLNGSGMTIVDTFTAAGDGLDLAAGSGGSSISSLTITAAPTAAIGVSSGANTLTGDTFSDSGDGVLLLGSNNSIGGAGSSGNVITGNTVGMLINGGGSATAGTTGNVVAGNFIGTNATGGSGLGNGTGLIVEGGAINNTIGGSGSGAGNVISGNSGDGVQVNGSGTSNNVISGNFIGTNPAGSGALGNLIGVVVGGGATNNTIGSTKTGAGNLISGNTNDGVDLNAGTLDLQGNTIGTNDAGTQALGNGNDGVRVNGVNDTVTSNLISGNSGNGLTLVNGGTLTLQGNTIGTNGAGTLALGNAGDGVLLGGGNNTVTANLISGNSGEGVQVQGAGNLLTGNSIGTDIAQEQPIPNLEQAVQFPTAAATGTPTNTLSGGAVWAGNNTVAIDAGDPAHVRPDTLVGGFSTLIGSAENMSVTAGSPTSTPGAGTNYPITISGGQANDTVTVQMYSTSCTGNVAKLQYVRSGTGKLNASGSGEVLVAFEEGDPDKPLFLADGQNAGVNNLADPCTSSSPPPPPPAPPSPPPPTPTPIVKLPPFLLTSPNMAFAAPGQNPDAKWLAAVYHDLLNRPLDPGGLAFWSQQLANGVPRDDVVLEIEGTTPYLDNLIGSVFQGYLGRSASPSDVGFWALKLQSGLTDEQFEADVLGTPEFFSHAGGSDTSFLNGLYEVLLGRPADPAAAQLLAIMTHQQIATTVLSSTEYRTDLITSWYLRFLRHAPDSAGVNFYLNHLAAGNTDEQVIAAILSSGAYFHQFSPATLTSVAISGNGSMKLALGHAATLTMQVSKVLQPGTGVGLVPVVQHGLAGDPAASKFKLPKLKRIGSVNFGQQRKGHHTLHWNRRVAGKRLHRGSYELVLQVRRGGKLVDVSDAIPFTVH